MTKSDQKLMLALRRNARSSISDLALELGVSRSTIRARMERLERSGDILGYTVVTKSDAFEQPVRGIMLIKVEGNVTERVLLSLNRLSEISSIHTTNGRWDLIVELGTDTLEVLDEVLRKIRLIKGVAASETNLYLATKRSPKLAVR